MVAEFFAATEEGEFDEKGDADHVRSEAVEQLQRRAGGAAGGQEVIHQQDGFAGGNGIVVELNHRFAIFQRIGDLAGFPPSRSATAAAKMKPRASMPTTLSIHCPSAAAQSREIASWNSAASARIGVMSLKTMPGFGKSATSRIAARRESAEGMAMEVGQCRWRAKERVGIAKCRSRFACFPEHAGLEFR